MGDDRNIVSHPRNLDPQVPRRREGTRIPNNLTIQVSAHRGVINEALAAEYRKKFSAPGRGPSLRPHVAAPVRTRSIPSTCTAFGKPATQESFPQPVNMHHHELVGLFQLGYCVGCQTQLFSDRGFYKHLGSVLSCSLVRKYEFKPMPGCLSNPVRPQVQAAQQLQMQSHFSERNRVCWSLGPPHSGSIARYNGTKQLRPIKNKTKYEFKVGIQNYQHFRRRRFRCF